MTETYGTTAIPSDSITVTSGGTVAISAAFEATVGLVGGYDAANGSATGGTVTTVESSADAAAKFGEESELKRQADLAFQNGASAIYAVPVAETEVTEQDLGTSGTLNNTPIFDPNVQPEHTITASDSGGTDPDVTITYESPPATPTASDEVAVNPVTGEYEFDSSAAGSYDLDYAYGDYEAAIQEVVTKSPRQVAVCTEATSVANSLLTELNTQASSFAFSHGTVGGLPGTDSSAYSDAFDARRLSVTLPSRGYTDDAETTEVRTIGAVAGRLSAKPLGNSATYDDLGGLASLRTSYTNSELGTLIDSQVLPLKQGGGITLVKDMTTSQDPRFERVYASEIVDEVTEISHQISQDFIGRPNTGTNRTSLAESHRSSLAELRSDALLNAFAVSVGEGASEDTVVLDLGINVVGVMDTIDVTVTVGDVITFQGAA